MTINDEAHWLAQRDKLDRRIRRVIVEELRDKSEVTTPSTVPDAIRRRQCENLERALAKAAADALRPPPVAPSILPEPLRTRQRAEVTLMPKEAFAVEPVIVNPYAAAVIEALNYGAGPNGVGGVLPAPSNIPAGGAKK